MPRSVSASARVVRSVVEIAALAPLVIARRTARMVTAGLPPRAADLREFHRMGAEKVDGFSRSVTVLLTSPPGPATVARALEPVRTRVRSNARRLASRAR
ncbi:hypothetical protein [Pseudonocardia spirodelae]|uniref:Uncharacterized protein n=1 Tax=Pseudonocardia spirodelae TaxID=3133431 RepID=A0ABU8TA65_9PSEU